MHQRGDGNGKMRSPRPRGVTGSRLPLGLLGLCLLLAGLAAAAASAATEPLPARVAEDTQAASTTTIRPITAVVLRSFPPYYQTRPDGTPTGFAREVMDQVARDAGLRVQYLVMDDWTAAQAALRDGRAHLIPGMTPTPERRREFVFTSPVFVSACVILVRAGDGSVQAPPDLAGKSVGLIQGAIVPGPFEGVAGIRFQRYGDSRQVLGDLLAGRLDAAVGAGLEIRALVAQQEAGALVRVVEVPGFEYKRAIALRPGDSDLLVRLETATRAVIRSPAYVALVDTWYGPPHSPWTPARLAALFGLALLGCVVGLGLWHYRATVRLNTQLHRTLADAQRAEAALRESHDLLARFIQNSPIYAFLKEVTPDQSRVLYASENYVDMIGIAGSAMVGKTMADLFPADFAAKITADDWAVVSGGTVLQLDEELHGRSYATIKFPIAQGARTLLAGYSIDLTARKEAEAALSASVRKFRQLFEGMATGCALHEMLYDAEGRPCDYRFLEINSAFEALTGLRREAVVGKRALEILPVLDPFWVESYGRVASTGTPERFEHYEATLGRWFDVAAYGPGPGQFAAIFSDITARKLAEAALQGERDLLQAVMDGAQTAHLVYLDSAFNFVRVNAPYAATCGYTPEAMVGLNHFTLYPHPENEAIFARVRDTGVPYAVHDKPFTFPDQPDRGTTYWDWTLTPVKNATGSVTGLVYALFETTVRKRAEMALQESEAKFATVFRDAPALIAITDLATGAYLDVNDEALRVSGFTRMEVLGHTASELGWITAAERTHLVQTLQAHGRIVGLEMRFRTKSGRRVVGVVCGEQIRVGNTPCLLTVTTDVTARVEAEAALRTSETRLRLALAAAQAGTWEWDLATNVNTWSDELWPLYGLDRAAWPASYAAWQASIHPDDRPAVEATVQTAVSQGAEINLTWRVHGSAPARWLLSRGQPYRDAAGRVIAYHGIVLDITATKETEQALAVRTTQLEALREVGAELTQELDLGRLLDLILTRALALTQTTSGTLFLWDERAEHLVPEVSYGLGPWYREVRLRLGEGVAGTVAQRRTGLVVNDFQRSPYLLRQLLVAHPEVGAVRTSLGEPLLYQGRLCGVLLVRDKASGAPFTRDDADLLRLFTTQAAIAIENARLYTTAQAALDAQQRAQAELVRTEQLRGLGQMAAGIAHDLNNTLATVLGQVEIAKHGLVPPALQEVHAAIETAASDGAATVRRIQEFARPKGTSPLAPCDLGALVRETVEMTQPRWKDAPQQRGVTVTVTCALPDLPPILGYPPELREALTNLIFNAVDAMPHGGTLTFRGTATVSTVTLAVVDTGIGMPPEIQMKVFEPFFTTKGVQGTGLGLAVVYGIMERHGGNIAVASALGQGTTFALTFQRVPATAAAAPTPATAAAPPQAPARLLVVDDEAGVRRTLARLLTLAGHQVVEAPDGPQALDLLATTPVDCVLTDLGMPEMNGWELARRIKAAHPRLPVILLTGWQDQAAGDEYDRAGVECVLGKPVKLPDLLRALAGVVGAARAN